MCCVQQMGTHMHVCMEARRTPQAQRCSRMQALLLPSLPLLLQMSPLATGNPCRWLKPLMWPMFAGAESESCIISLQELISLSIWSVNIKLASQCQIPERRRSLLQHSMSTACPRDCPGSEAVGTGAACYGAHPYGVPHLARPPIQAVYPSW